MKIQTFSYNYSDLDVKISDVESVLSKGNTSESDSYVRGIIQEISGDFAKKSTLQGGFVINEDVKFNTANATLQVDSIFFNVKKIIFNEICKSKQIAFFVCTAGELVDTWSSQLINEGNFLEGYIVDLIGSLAVEKAMDTMQKELQEQMKLLNLNITNRYSPGYCGWIVTEQQKLFSLLPENFCNIKLNESSLMYPIKSVSGLIGIGADVKFADYSCNCCGISNCLYSNLKSGVNK